MSQILWLWPSPHTECGNQTRTCSKGGINPQKQQEEDEKQNGEREKDRKGRKQKVSEDYCLPLLYSDLWKIWGCCGVGQTHSNKDRKRVFTTYLLLPCQILFQLYTKMHRYALIRVVHLLFLSAQQCSLPSKVSSKLTSCYSHH